MNEGLIQVLSGLLLLMTAALLTCWSVFYTMGSAGLYILAKRRGLRRPWLAWFPGARNWVLGALSDQYCYVTRGLRRSIRWPFLVAALASGLCWMFTALTLPGLFLGEVTWDAFWGRAGFFLICPAVFLGMKLPVRYRVFRSCVGPGAALYSTLALLVPGAESALLLWCCRRDGGMPPRKRCVSPDAVPTDESSQEERHLQ